MQIINIFDVINGKRFLDDRGFVSVINDFSEQFNDIKRMYIVENHVKGFIRAWHGHANEDKYALMLNGVAILAATPLSFNNEPIIKYDAITISSDNPSIIKIPKGNYNGFKLLTDNAKIMFFSTSNLTDSIKDDFRRNLTKDDLQIFNVVER